MMYDDDDDDDDDDNSVDSVDMVNSGGGSSSPRLYPVLHADLCDEDEMIPAQENSFLVFMSETRSVERDTLAL